MDESLKSTDALQIYAKEASGLTCENDQIVLLEEDKHVYEIKMRDDEFEDDSRVYKEEDHLLDPYEERIEDTIDEEYMLTTDEILTEKQVDKNTEEFEVYEMEPDNEGDQEQPEDIPQTSHIHLQSKELPPPRTIASPAKNVVDPDERYLMSCLPAFKRFTPQQKAYVRMGIERLFYEVEFENVSEPRSKKSRMS